MPYFIWKARVRKADAVRTCLFSYKKINGGFYMDFKEELARKAERTEKRAAV